MWWNKQLKDDLQEATELNIVYEALVKELEGKLKRANDLLVAKKIDPVEDEHRKQHTHLNAEEKKELVETFVKNKHLTKREIAKYYNISYSTLCATLRAAKVSTST